MTEAPTLMSIADPAMIDGPSMTPIILKPVAWKEGRERIAGNPANGGRIVSG